MKLFRSIANQPSPEKATTVFIKPGKNGLLSKNISSKTMQLTDSGTMETRDKERGKVRWQEEHNKAHKNGRIIGRAEMRTEFDIAPDWRAPKRSVVPMTQITRQLEVQERLPSTLVYRIIDGSLWFTQSGLYIKLLKTACCLLAVLVEAAATVAVAIESTKF